MYPFDIIVLPLYKHNIKQYIIQHFKICTIYHLLRVIRDKKVSKWTVKLPEESLFSNGSEIPLFQLIVLSELSVSHALLHMWVSFSFWVVGSKQGRCMLIVWFFFFELFKRLLPLIVFATNVIHTINWQQSLLSSYNPYIHLYHTFNYQG